MVFSGTLCWLVKLDFLPDSISLNLHKSFRSLYIYSCLLYFVVFLRVILVLQHLRWRWQCCASPLSCLETKANCLLGRSGCCVVAEFMCANGSLTMQGGSLCAIVSIGRQLCLLTKILKEATGSS